MTAQPVSTPPQSDDLYEVAKRVHPRTVKGTFRNAKWILMTVLLAIWHLGPFLRWDRGPNAPDQAILIDMAGRRAYFYFIEIWPQEVYYVTGLLLIAGLALFLMSAVAGRVWCGFLCFQTVYTDLFVWVEQRVIGDRGKRIAFDKKPYDFDKLWRKSIIYGAWGLISLACGVGFVLYFDDAYTLLPKIFTGDAGSNIYLFLGLVGGGCFIMAGFMREQLCIYMCPYSRFQAAMFDEHTMVVAYEAWRGEPRSSARKGQSFEGRGHCVDCNACVVSCPTGVDIRMGNQLACIGCALCIDACNQMMDRYQLPRGLISYDSIAAQAARADGKVIKLKPVRTRTIVYVLMLALVVGGMGYTLAYRPMTEVSIIHERSPLYIQLRAGDIRNGYTYKILNMVRKERHLKLSAEGIDGVKLDVVGEQLTDGTAILTADGDSIGSYRVYVTAPYGAIKSHATPFKFVLEDEGDGSKVTSSAIFMGPEK
jgi:cytochrome c oxidase accessory protein FixG